MRPSRGSLGPGVSWRGSPSASGGTWVCAWAWNLQGGGAWGPIHPGRLSACKSFLWLPGAPAAARAAYARCTHPLLPPSLNRCCLLPALLFFMGRGGVHQSRILQLRRTGSSWRQGLGREVVQSWCSEGWGTSFISASLTLSTGLESVFHGPSGRGAK